jgi:hypothetical protein
MENTRLLFTIIIGTIIIVGFTSIFIKLLYDFRKMELADKKARNQLISEQNLEALKDELAATQVVRKKDADRLSQSLQDVLSLLRQKKTSNE